ncbi:YhcH/YjgK/YiaL family protein [Thermoclostridium stercorarium]|uniref:YhcH/YjgK/YiaL family protein n=1 Tax=Thermoclostridium stercorarium TaxID=1510 RepID=UPI0034E604CE
MIKNGKSKTMHKGAEKHDNRFIGKLQTVRGFASRFQKAFRFIREFHQNEKEDGRYEIDGNDVYALVQSYTTLPSDQCKWESHDKYIDIQYIVRGKEIIATRQEIHSYPAQATTLKRTLLFMKTRPAPTSA